jgi:peptidoglycan hydrolase CwlO-like protein
MIKTDNIDSDILNKIKSIDTDIKSVANKIGTVYLKRKDLQKSIEEANNVIESLENDYNKLNISLNLILSDLKKKYNSGTIDLLNGTITYTTEHEN